MRPSALVFLTVACLTTICARAQQRPQPERTEAEQYVLVQIKDGEPADFNNRPDKDLSAAFITELLTNADSHIPISQHGITIQHATITGDVDLINADVPNDISLNATFQGDFNASQCHFRKTLDLSGSTFLRPVDFENAVIEFDFIIDNCRFNVSAPGDNSAFFKGVRVGRDWSMQPTDRAVEFNGPADFTQSDVGGKLLANGVMFRSDTDFDSMRVRGETLLRESQFGRGEVKFSDTHFGNLFLDDVHFENLSVLDLTRMQVDSVFLDRVAYPNAGSVKIEGMTFKSMSPASWDGLRDLRSHLAYDPEFYTNLETLFRSHGHTNQADQVFIEKQRLDRRAICASFFHSCQRGRWIFSVLEDWLTGYGRSLENLLLWSIGFVMIGTFVFRRTAMKRGNPSADDAASRRARSNLRYWRLRRWLHGLIGGFWYSLDVFLPIIELGEREHWEPKDNRRAAIFYKKIHAIIGHLFVPIGLAAWTGIIK